MVLLKTKFHQFIFYIQQVVINLSKSPKQQEFEHITNTGLGTSNNKNLKKRIK
jgi:hypothetical protein